MLHLGLGKDEIANLLLPVLMRFFPSGEQHAQGCRWIIALRVSFRVEVAVVLGGGALETEHTPRLNAQRHLAVFVSRRRSFLGWLAGKKLLSCMY